MDGNGVCGRTIVIAKQRKAGFDTSDEMKLSAR